jgi:hypothetical protein
MKKGTKKIDDDDMLPEYDFSGGVRGKYAARLAEENGYVKLDPAVIKYFKKSEDINRVLLAIIDSMANKRKAISV